MDDPFPDEYQDAGGVASPLVPGVVAIRLQAVRVRLAGQGALGGP